MSLDAVEPVSTADTAENSVDLHAVADRVMDTLAQHVETIHGATTVVRNAIAGFPGLQAVLVPRLQDSKHSAVIEKLQLQPQ